MIRNFINFLHHMFNPHCEHCKLERERILQIEREQAACPTCAVLKAELEKAQQRHV